MSYLTGFTNLAAIQPKDDIDPKEKNESWAKKWGEFFISKYMKDELGFHYSKRAEYEENRAYGRGEQSVKPFMESFLGKADPKKEPGSAERKGFMNVDWRVFSPAPKFRNVVIGKFLAVDMKIGCQSLDPQSGVERENQKWATWVDSDAGFGKEIKSMLQATGIDPAPPETYNAKSKEDFELFEAINGFKIGAELSMQEIVNYSYYISNWDEVKAEIYGEMFDNNAICIQDVIGPDNKIRAKIRDLKDVIIHKPKDGDFKKATFAGHVEYVSISQLRRELLADGQDFEEDDLRAIAETYEGQFNNNSIQSDYDGYSGGGIDDNDRAGHFYYDRYILPVLNYEWASNNVEYHAVRSTKYGGREKEPLEFGTTELTGKHAKRKKIVTNSVNVAYKAKYIIGSNIVYNFGLKDNTVRDDETGQVILSYKVFKGQGSSLMKTIRPNIDNLYRAWIKYQNAIAQAPNSGIAIEFGVLQNMKLGGNKMEPFDIINIRRQEGTLIYKATTHRGVVNSPAAQSPIKELEGGAGKILPEMISVFQTELEFIREHTGLNQVVSGSDPDPEQSVGGSELAVTATENVLRPLYNGYLKVKKEIAESFVDRGSMLIRHSKKAYEGYYPIMGKAALQFFKIASGQISRKYGIFMIPELTAEDKSRLMRMAGESMAAAKEGLPGITPGDYLMIERVLSSGNDKWAEIFLNAKLAQAEKKIQANKKEMLTIQGKEDRATAEAKAKLEEDKAIAEHNRAIELLNKEKENKIAIEEAKGTQGVRIEKARKETELAKIGETNELEEVEEEKK